MKRYAPLLPPLFYLFLTLLLTYPLVFRLPSYVADTGDPLLNTWALAWGQRALLLPWQSVADLFNANAFYPYPYSLGFSEHLLLYAALTLPLPALGFGPIFAHNGAIIFSLALAGWGMALLVTYWTKNRWAGLIAGIIFAFVPARLNHWAHLHQLSIQWLPFVILTLDLWLTRRRRRHLLLFGLFLNLQLLSTINYIPQTIILVGLSLLFTLLSAPKRWFTTPILGGGLILLLITFLLNWPIVSVYFELSELHNFERGLGDATIYGAALSDYLTPPPENMLYGGWLTPHLFNAARPLIPLFIGVVPAILVIIGLFGLFHRQVDGRRVLILFLLCLTFVAVLLSFGANDQALGAGFSAQMRPFLLYRWLFEYVPGFSGLRVPARMVILAFFGLAALAGLGAAGLFRHHRWSGALLTVVGLLIVIEYLPLPLPGEDVPVGPAIPPVYAYLNSDPADKVVLELPYNLAGGGANEHIRLYYSAERWYGLINGASGFNPPGLRDLSRQLQRFPDAVSFDLLRQLGVTHLLLHSAEFEPDHWTDIWSKLPTFWSSIGTVSQFGDDYLLTLRPAACSPQSEAFVIHPARSEGRLSLTFTNQGPVTYVVDPETIGRVQSVDDLRQFLPPLFISPGETRTVDHLFPLPSDAPDKIRLDLPNLLQRELEFDQTAEPGPATAGPTRPETALDGPEIALGMQFGDEASLLGYSLISPGQINCRLATLRLYWATANAMPDPNTVVTVRQVDRFGQTVASSPTVPWADPLRSDQELLIDDHRLPVLETTPAGQYGLAVRLVGGQGQTYPPTNTGERLVVDDEVLLSDLIVRPAPPGTELPVQPIGRFENDITLQGAALDKTALTPGEWLHVTLFWQTAQPLAENLTVFTQLVDAHGQVWGQFDNPPRNGWYPTPLWQPGEIISDDYVLQLDLAAPPGQLQLRIGFYYPDTLVRAPVVTETGNNVVADHLTVSTLEVRSENENSDQ